MAIQFVQSITARSADGGVSSFTLELSGVAPGNTLILTLGMYESENGVGYAQDGLPSVSSTPAETWVMDAAGTVQMADNSAERGVIFSVMSAAGGNIAVTLTPDPGTALYIAASLSEFSGIAASSGLDKIAFNGGQTSSGVTASPTSGTTATTEHAHELVVAALAAAPLAYSIDMGIDPATTGYTNLGLEQNGWDFNAYSGDYKVVSTTGPQNASWGSLNNNTGTLWSAAIATYIENRMTGITPQNPGTIYESSPGTGAPVNFTVTSQGITNLSWVVQNGPPGYEWQSAANTIATTGSVSFTATFTQDGQFLKLWDTNDASSEAYSGQVNVETNAATSASPMGASVSSAATFIRGTTSSVRQASVPSIDRTASASLAVGSASGVRNAAAGGASATATATQAAGSAGAQIHAAVSGKQFTATANSNSGASPAGFFFTVYISPSPGAVSYVQNGSVPGANLLTSAGLARGNTSGQTFEEARILREDGGYVLDEQGNFVLREESLVFHRVGTSLTTGAASAEVWATPAGTVATATASLVAGSVTAAGETAVGGVSITKGATLAAGGAMGQIHITSSGVALAASSSLSSGAPNAIRHGVPAGVSRTSTVTLVAGAPSGSRHIEVAGATATATTGSTAGATTTVRRAFPVGASLTTTAGATPGAMSAAGGKLTAGANVSASTTHAAGAVETVQQDDVGGASLTVGASATPGAAVPQQWANVDGAPLAASASATPATVEGQERAFPAGVAVSASSALAPGGLVGTLQKLVSGVDLSAASFRQPGTVTGQDRALVSGVSVAANAVLANGIGTSLQKIDIAGVTQAVSVSMVAGESNAIRSADMPGRAITVNPGFVTGSASALIIASPIGRAIAVNAALNAGQIVPQTLASPQGVNLVRNISMTAGAGKGYRNAFRVKGRITLKDNAAVKPSIALQ